MKDKKKAKVRTDFNKLVKEINAFYMKHWKAKTLQNFDAAMVKFSKAYLKDAKNAKAKTTVTALAKPSITRNKIYAIGTKHATYLAAWQKDDKAGGHATTKRKLKEAIKKNGSAIAIGLSVTAVVLIICGVACCKYKEICCFNKDNAQEGGEREVYKKEVKSNNAHKRHAKE